MKKPLSRGGLVALAACAIAFALPAAASAASTVAIDTFGDKVTFTAATGIANQVVVTAALGSVTFSDPADTITEAEADCTGSGTNTVTCTDPLIAEWSVSVGNLGDSVTATSTIGGDMSGGDGDDTLTGGAAVEFLVDGAGKDTVTGNGGDDLALNFGADADADVINLGEGADTQFGLGAGDTANLGSGSDVFQFLASSGASGSIDGGPGLDRVEGFVEGGLVPLAIDLNVDTIAEKTPPGPADSLKSFEDVSGTLVGGDTITGGPEANSIRTGISPGFLLILSGPVTFANGDDVVNPFAGADSVDTGAGNDTITTNDGYSDRVHCGAGADTVEADQFDSLEACEAVAVTRMRAAVADQRAPACRFTKAARKAKRKGFLSGYGASFSCDEDVTVSGKVVASAKAKGKRVAFAKVGDVVLAEKSIEATAGNAKRLVLKPNRRLARLLPGKFTARVVIEARDEFGNRTALTRKVKVTTPKVKRKRR